eukprot:m.113052 g.113052  ORF g.113052 m.113052 type:complete len:759 (-) comp15434_c0_seq1:81-2357(-)
MFSITTFRTAFVLCLLHLTRSRSLVYHHLASPWLMLDNDNATYILKRTAVTKPSFNSLTLPSLLSDSGWQLHCRLLDTPQPPGTSLDDGTFYDVPLPIVATMDATRVAFVSADDGVTVAGLASSTQQVIYFDPNEPYWNLGTRVVQLALAGDRFIAMLNRPDQPFAVVLWNLTANVADDYADFLTPNKVVSIQLAVTPDYMAVRAFNNSQNTSIGAIRGIYTSIVRLVNLPNPIIALDASEDLLVLADYDRGMRPQLMVYFQRSKLWTELRNVSYVSVSDPFVLMSNETTAQIGYVNSSAKQYDLLGEFTLKLDSILVCSNRTSSSSNATIDLVYSNGSICSESNALLSLDLIVSDLVVVTLLGMARLRWDIIKLLHVDQSGVICVTTQTGESLLLSELPTSSTTSLTTSSITSTSPESPGHHGTTMAVSSPLLGAAVGLGLFLILVLGLAIARRRDGYRKISMLPNEEFESDLDDDMLKSDFPISFGLPDGHGEVQRPLAAAGRSGHLQLAKLQQQGNNAAFGDWQSLLKTHPELYTYRDSDGRTLLMVACQQSNKPSFLALLLEYLEEAERIAAPTPPLNEFGVVTAYSNDGLTALHYAVLSGAVGCARQLGGHFPATLDQRTRPSGDTVLHLAIRQGSTEMMKVLLRVGNRAGCTLLLQPNRAGLTPLDLTTSSPVQDLLDKAWHKELTQHPSADDSRTDATIRQAVLARHERAIVRRCQRWRTPAGATGACELRTEISRAFPEHTLQDDVDSYW